MKEELSEAQELINCRLDLIEKVDCSDAGWTAAAFYQKSNGLKLKADSSKLWLEAEKAAREVKKKPEPKPFRYAPTSVGKFQRSQQGQIRVFSLHSFAFVTDPFVLCLSYAFPDWYHGLVSYSERRGNSVFTK